MLKIGIITHYLNSTNYGGNLQAYALCAYLNKQGYEAKQISYNRALDTPRPKSLISRAKRFLRKTQQNIVKLPLNIKTAYIRSELSQRENAVLAFNRSIPHTDIFTAETIASIVDKFDVFITGSDQVWNPLAVCSAYLLDFVNSDKACKMSYAASISVPELSEEVTERYKNSLKDYSAISVREKQAVELIQPHAEQRVEWVLDPTLLLDSEDWKSIASERFKDYSYIFCYFLGDSSEQRKIAEEYAKKHNLEIYTIPYLNGEFRKCDKSFGNRKLFDISPEDFIGLISNAKYVFTDSFHAVVFSLIFKKQFVVFDRIIKQSLGSRIKDLTDMFDVGERFCDTSDKFSLDYVEALNDINYSQAFLKYKKMKENSAVYLTNNLCKAKEMRKK